VKVKGDCKYKRKALQEEHNYNKSKGGEITFLLLGQSFILLLKLASLLLESSLIVFYRLLEYQL